MSFCTYIASDKPLSESTYLWPLSRSGEDIYTEKVYVAQIIPDLDDLSGVLSYIQNHLKTAEQLVIKNRRIKKLWVTILIIAAIVIGMPLLRLLWIVFFVLRPPVS